MKIQKQNTKYKKNLKQLLNNNKKELRVLKILEQN